MTTQQELAERLADYQKYRHMSDGPLMVPPADELIDEVITALRAPPNIGDAPRKELAEMTTDTNDTTAPITLEYARQRMRDAKSVDELCDWWEIALDLLQPHESLLEVAP